MPPFPLNLFKKTKILVVEDDNALRKVLCDKLAMEGFKVMEARDGQEGFKMAIMKHPDLILLDLMLPEMDGISALEELRKDSWGAAAKVLIMTNLKKGESLGAQTEKYKVAGFIEKADTSIDDIVMKIKEVL
ncbi:MAG: response regulator [Candidatus Paceibacterota bacterium]|jgi:DNA-binding response OmpR family regulator